MSKRKTVHIMFLMGLLIFGGRLPKAYSFVEPPMFRKNKANIEEFTYELIRNEHKAKLKEQKRKESHSNELFQNKEV